MRDGFREAQARDEKIRSDFLSAADTLTALGNAAEQLLGCVRALNGNLRAERPRLSDVDLIELIKCYQAVRDKQEQVAIAIDRIRRARQAASARDEKIIDDAMGSAGMSQILALEALKGKKEPG
jgi:hypothetical protein